MYKILIVDDSTDNIFSLKDALNMADNNYEFLEALDGKQALKMMEKHDIALVLLDIMMPIMDGMEFLKRVKKNKKFSKIPIFVISAITNVSDIKKINKLGIDFHDKPFNIRYVQHKVAELLKP
jgi:DNA-binding response OmpR family regulator